MIDGPSLPARPLSPQPSKSRSLKAHLPAPRPVRRALVSLVAVALVAGAAAGTAFALGKSDPGADYQHQLEAQSQALFGFGKPLDQTVSGTFSGPGDQAVELAGGLTATISSSTVGENADMIALWPNDANPTHAIICNEITGAPAGSPATLQRVDLSNGDVSNIAFGLNSCDPAHRTAWGTIVFAEEAGTGGRFYELIDPLHADNITINRTTGTTSDPSHIVVRKALGQLSFEGVVVLPDGTVYYGDELRPTSGTAASGSTPATASKPGGGIYKFVPTTPRSGGAGITSLDQSPLASGNVSVLRLASSGRSFGDAGQGANSGEGKWVPLTAPADNSTYNLAAAALAAGGYTGFYRPEDMDLDPLAWAQGNIRTCWNDTGNDAAGQWGETLCLTDTPTTNAAFTGGYRPVVEPFIIGNSQLRMPDNLDFQPGTGILYVLMDATTSAENPDFANDQVWACLPDGSDPDVLTDGCVRVANLKDGEAEFTGIEFRADGRSFYIHIQHRTQTGRVVPHTTDELLISGLDPR